MFLFLSIHITITLGDTAELMDSIGMKSVASADNITELAVTSRHISSHNTSLSTSNNHSNNSSYGNILEHPSSHSNSSSLSTIPSRPVIPKLLHPSTIEERSRSLSVDENGSLNTLHVNTSNIPHSARTSGANVTPPLPATGVCCKYYVCT